MPVKIRLQRRGRKKRPFYHIVVADSRAPRDGRFIEKIGTYNPMTKPATIDIDRDKAYDWLIKGAQPTNTARAILRFKGVYYRKHLMRGVQKGAITQEEADKKYETWIEAKETRIAERRQQALEETNAFHAMVAGTPPPPPSRTEEEEETTVTEEELAAAEADVEAPIAKEEGPEAEQGSEAEANPEAGETSAEEEPTTDESEEDKK